MVNSDLIKFVEKAPDTVLTLVSGEKVIVLESADAILEKIVAFRRKIMPGLLPEASDEAVTEAASADGEAAPPAQHAKES